MAADGDREHDTSYGSNSERKWLRRTEFDLELLHMRHRCRLRFLEVEFEGFPEVGERSCLGFALAGDIHFETLGDVPLSLADDASREHSLHARVLSFAY